MESVKGVAGNSELLTLHLAGVRKGMKVDNLISALKSLISGQPEEKIRQALQKLPLILTRSATKEQAKKIKAFLEPKGAILKITYSRPAVPAASATVEAEKKSEKPKVASPQKSLTKETEKPALGVDRRSKPRVHSGIQIQRMGIGEILDRSFRVLKKHFWLFFIILLIPQVIFFLVSKVLQLTLVGGVMQNPSLAMGISFGFSFFIAFIVFIVLQFWAQGALIHAVSETYLGHSTSIGGAYGAMRSRIGRLLGTLILMSILLMLPMAGAGIVSAILIPILQSTGVGGGVTGLLVALIIIGFLVVFIKLLLNWLMVDKVVVLEEKAWLGALRRSKELMNTEAGFLKGTKTKAGFILFLGFIIGIGIHLLLQVPGFAFLFLMPGSIIGSTIQEVLSIIATSLATVFAAIAMILFYYDIRVRSEGFDLKMMAKNL